MRSEPNPQSAAARASRRAFLHALIGSPLLLAAERSGALGAVLAHLEAGDPSAELIARARDAIQVFDFEAVARHKLSEAHWTYLSMGVQDEWTLRRNRSAFERYQLRPRRLVDGREVDTSLELFGQKLSSPILLCPCGSQKAFHPEGELAVARAARSMDHVQILSTGSSTPLEEVVEARGDGIWFQLYTPRMLSLTSSLVKRAEAAGCPVLVLTVDQAGVGMNRERLHRFRRDENPECGACHNAIDDSLLRGRIHRTLGAVGIDTVDLVRDFVNLDWDALDRIRDATSMKLVVKGILTAEDAERVIEHGADGIMVSNHGGRAEDTGLSSIEVLPEIAGAVRGRVPILVDSGFRRATDVLKALALGATAVGVGRPYLWGLSAFGQEGVEAVLTLLRRDLEGLMVEMGTPTLAAISPSHVRETPR